MSCKYSLLCVFLCGFAVLSVSEICGRETLEGTSCSIKLKTKNYNSANEIKWTHVSSGNVIVRRKGKIRTNTLGGAIEEDGSLTFHSVSLNNTGKYKYSFYDSDGIESSEEEDIKVYAKAPKPTAIVKCGDKVTVSCDAGDRTDLTVSWFKEDKPIQNENNPKLLSSPEENKQYSCRVSNPVSSEKSDSVTASCEGSGHRKLFGFDFWIMVSILAGGGALLLLLICVLIICACRSCSQCKKHEHDKEELRQRPKTVKTAHYRHQT